MVAGDLGQDAVPLEQRDHDHLREQADAGLLQHAPARLRLQPGRPSELDADDQALAPHILDHVVLCLQLPESLHQLLAAAGGVLHQALVVDNGERGQPGGHGQRAALEGGGVNHKLVHGGVNRRVDLVGGQHRAHRHVAARERLGYGHDVRPHVAVVLIGEEAAGAAQADLDLVADQQGTVLMQQRLGLRQEPGRRHHHAVPLDRLDDQRGDVALAQLGLERAEIAERDLGAGQQRAEAVLELLRAVHRQRPGGQPVEAMPGIDDAALAGGVAGELERRLDRFGAAAAEEHPLEPGRLGQQSLREQALDRLAVELRPGREVHLERVSQRLLDHRVRPAGREHPEPRQEVRVSVALGVVEVRTLAAHVVLVEADGVQRPRQLRVEVASGELVALSGAAGQQAGQIKGHGLILSRPRGRPGDIPAQHAPPRARDPVTVPSPC